jgi:hypothetical protein
MSAFLIKRQTAIIARISRVLKRESLKAMPLRKVNKIRFFVMYPELKALIVDINRVKPDFVIDVYK